MNNHIEKEETILYDVFLNAGIGQVVVDEDQNIVLANNWMLEYFGLKTSRLNGTSFGLSFCCRGYEDVCGHREKCNCCEINKAMQSLWRDNIHTEGKVIPFSFHHGKNHAVKWFQLCTGCMTYCSTQYAILTFTDVTRLKHNERRLQVRLTLDPATGILNKSSLIFSIQRLTSGKRENKDFTMCMVDFDNFKALNDQYGHLFGDRVLKAFANIARKHIRKSDTLGRFGGEEFIFIFMNSDEEQSLKILERIHKELEEYFSRDSILVTFSAGIFYVSKDVYAPAQLFGEIDKRLYQAKKQGRGRAISNIGETVFT